MYMCMSLSIYTYTTHTQKHLLMENIMDFIRQWHFMKCVQVRVSGHFANIWQTRLVFIAVKTARITVMAAMDSLEHKHIMDDNMFMASAVTCLFHHQQSPLLQTGATTNPYVTVKLPYDSQRFNDPSHQLFPLKEINSLIFVFVSSCSIITCRYDLRIRYIPKDFLEKFKGDETTLLYFYQQVNVCVSACVCLSLCVSVWVCFMCVFCLCISVNFWECDSQSCECSFLLEEARTPSNWLDVEILLYNMTMKWNKIK